MDRQNALIHDLSQGFQPLDVTPEEQMLVDLIQNDRGIRGHSGLRTYIHNMMAVMDFDAERRGRLISHNELNVYARTLAVAVTEALHYFIGHNCYSPRSEDRYLAVTAAHITHMLRDTLDDNAAGYFNIPREYLEANEISPFDVESEAYRSLGAEQGSVGPRLTSRPAGDTWPGLNASGAGLPVMPTSPASRQCWIRSNRTTIFCAPNTRNAKQ